MNDMYGRGPQTSKPTKLKLFVEIYSMIGEYPFAELGKKIDQKWVEFTTYNTEAADIDEEFNICNKNHSISYNVMAIQPA